MSPPLVLRSYGGLEPQAWLVVGAGFSKEEVKGLFLRRGVGLTSRGILTLTELATWIVASGSMESTVSDRLLSRSSRQEGLRLILANAQIRKYLPELGRLKRQRGFWKRLDRAIQGGRRSFARAEDAQVLHERLQERYGDNPIRNEVMILSTAWEAWLEAQNLWDEVRLLREATRILEVSGEAGLPLPPQVDRLAIGAAESLEAALWESLARRTQTATYDPVQFANALQGVEQVEKHVPETAWKRPHGVDDAAEFCAEQWLSRAQSDLSIWEKTALLIPDEPAVRRAVTRALTRRGIPLADPRDPTQLKWDERAKRALLPLQLASRGFEREAVVEWIRGEGSATPTSEAVTVSNAHLIDEIYARGIRQSLDSYDGGLLTALHERLSGLQSRFGGRKSIAQLREAHLEWISSSHVAPIGEKVWAHGLFTRAWDTLLADLERVGSSDRVSPVLHWIDRLELRIEEMAPPPAALRPQYGVRLYRLSQAPVESIERLVLFAPPAQWLEGGGAGDFWFTEKEREILSAEFEVRSSVSVRNERTLALKAWLALAHEVEIYDPHYDWDGRERESLLPFLIELGLPEALKAEELGAASHHLRSYGPPSTLGGEEGIEKVELPWISDPDGSLRHDPRLRIREGKPDFAATTIDRYSRCPFQALVSSRWKLKEPEPPEPDLPFIARGNLLHAAVGLLLNSRKPGSTDFTITPEQALDLAWDEVKPRGMLRGRRLAEIARKRLVPTLVKFSEKEREYVERSQTTVKQLEGPALHLDLGSFIMSGIPDRIDEHADGYFIIDYKSGSKQPQGKQMIDLGYRLQLPFYAVALPQVWKEKPVIGLQFIELNRKGTRSNGIFFSNWVGKDEGKLVSLGGTSKSWIKDLDPPTVWSALRGQLEHQGQSLLAGKFTAQPKLPTECRDCFSRDLCHERRRRKPENEEGAE